MHRPATDGDVLGVRTSHDTRGVPAYLFCITSHAAMGACLPDALEERGIPRPSGPGISKDVTGRDVLHSASPGMTPDEVLKYMKRVGKTNYPDGSSTMPRSALNGLHIASGTAGSMLMLISEK